MKFKTAVVLTGLALSYLAGSALAAPASNPFGVSASLGGQSLTWLQSSAPAIDSSYAEYTLFDGSRNVGWVRMTRSDPTTQRLGIDCPKIDLAFGILNLQEPQSFIFNVAGPSFPTISNPQLRFSGDIKITDNANSGASLMGNGVGGAVYEAAVNGPVGFGGTTVASGITSPLVADDGEMATDSFDTDCFRWSGDVNALHLRASVDVSEFATVEGFVRFEVCCSVPLPTGASLAATGLLVMAGIRRRRA